MVRLNKYLSLCGLGSRRKVEELITSGRVCVNGVPVKSLARTIDPENDAVSCDSVLIAPRDRNYYIMLNKPKGYITTLSDERGRPTVMEMIPGKYVKAGVFPIGRLDKDTEGLLLLTNDGEMANRLSRPENKIIKGYHVELDRPLAGEDKKKIEKGIFLHQINLKTRPAKINLIGPTGKSLMMYISEGKKRQIRYTFKIFHYTVTYLRRDKYGPLELSGLKKGEIRLLKKNEIKMLESLLGDE